MLLGLSVLVHGTAAYLIGRVLFWSKPGRTPWAEALWIDAGFMLLFTLQHSGMARDRFHRWWRARFPWWLERPVYALASSSLLIVMCANWAAPPTIFFDLRGTPFGYVLTGLGLLAGGLIVLSLGRTGAIDLLGWQQVQSSDSPDPIPPSKLVVRGPYRWVRHPLVLGTLLFFWVWPLMTSRRLLFAAGMTLYVVFATPWEERDLERTFGEDYRRYRKRVPGWIPRLRRRSDDEA